MIKNEIKVEYFNSEDLKSLIQKAYFDEGQMGKIVGKKHHLSIPPSDDINWTIFKGLNNVTVKITNEIIDGSCRFLIDDTDDSEIKLHPISIYCIVEKDKYTFY